jgi:hypothetical protein
VVDSKNQTEQEDRAKEEAYTGPVPRDFAVPGNDLTGYIGVAPEYMNYADPTHKPYLTEEEAWLYTNLDDEAIDATRNRTTPDGVEVPENEMPAVAENTAGSVSGAMRRREDRDSEEQNSDKEGDVSQNEEKLKSEPGVVPGGPAAAPTQVPAPATRSPITPTK